MNFKELTQKMIELNVELKDAQNLAIPQLVESAALEFVDDNFRNQGWEGQPWQKNERDGTILVQTGALRRGFESSVSPGRVEIRNEIKYAWVHNEGFDELVAIPAHQRATYKALGGGKLKKTGSGAVSAHNRKVRLPKRQFAPTEASPSPTLNALVDKIIASHILSLTKT